MPRTHLLRALIPAAVAVAGFAGAPLASATPIAGTPQTAPATIAPAASTQGIIMRDGGVCDPIRHMGC